MTSMEKLPEKQQCKLANAILQNNSMNTFCKAEIQLIGHFKRSTASLVWWQFLPRWASAPVDPFPLGKLSSRLLTHAPHKQVTDLQFIRTMLETPPRMKFTLFTCSANTVRYCEKQGSASTASLNQKTKENKVLFLQGCTATECQALQLVTERVFQILVSSYRSQEAARKGNLTKGTDSQRFQKWKLMENYLTLTQVNWTWESLFKNKEVTMSFPNLWAITWPRFHF